MFKVAVVIPTLNEEKFIASCLNSVIAQSYPFEDMDPEQNLETYKDEDKIILEVTTNKKQKLTDKEILEAIIKY